MIGVQDISQKKGLGLLLGKLISLIVTLAHWACSRADLRQGWQQPQFRVRLRSKILLY